ncbi:tetratricopeptide (TPR) repeat protein [Actinokineospora baliensis]|uniref:ATP-binding protein n=1 Tax=Actinokineospora baliensis TaxID=547056 RepID=UPI00195E4F82|nr:tetratricopeptide repeat protein [Actinokineospora baliensis]MBM7774809.1 tetratricopeptide (TPR) repeat protein [Actinokineospora baliensis]
MSTALVEVSGVETPGVRNEVIAGAVGPVVQAGVVHGGVHLHEPVAVVPRQLPAASGMFAGRVGELAELDRAAGGRVVVIVGAGGIGKTWLALAWAHRQLRRYPDGQLFVDLHGFSPVERPMAAAVAVRGFLDALGVEAGRIPDGLAAQAGLYRSLVAGRRMLIVLDNAASAAQVAQLLPGGGSCAVVVTTRAGLAGVISRFGAHALRLGPLNDDEAHALLSTRLGSHRVADAAAEVIALCGGSALALGLVAARAHSQPQVPLTEFAAELREFGVDALDDDDPTASLPAVLSLSVLGLTDELRTVFALLAIAPGPDISPHAAAALTAMPLPRIRACLRALEEASLLTRQPNSRYGIHDLIRGHATTIPLTEDARESALRRVFDFYLHTAHGGDLCLSPHRRPIDLDPPGCEPIPLTDRAAALEWFEAEHACLLAAYRVAAERGWHKEVWHLAWSLNTFHYRRGHLRDHLALWRSGLAAAERLGDPAILTHAHRQLGRACTRLGRYDEALAHLNHALQHTDDLGLAYTHQAIATAWERRGDDRQALEHATQALRLFQALGTTSWEAITRTMVGDCTARLGDHDQARSHYRAALTLHRATPNPSGEADIHCGLAYLAHQSGGHTAAVDHYLQALALYRALGDTYDIGPILDKLGHPYVALGRHEEAREVWHEALKLYREQGRAEDARRLEAQLTALEG